MTVNNAGKVRKTAWSDIIYLLTKSRFKQNISKGMKDME